MRQSASPADFIAPLDLSPAAPPKSRQLESALKAAIRGGRLRAGVRLPASRSFAEQLGCSRWVVVQTYEQLAAEGYLVSRSGSGTRVADLPAAPASPPGPPDRLPSWTYDFKPGIPDLSSFPRQSWSRSARKAIAEVPVPLLDYGDPSGLDTLRRALADHLGRLRGLATDPAQMFVTTGTTEALGTLARALADRGVTRIGVEDPGWIPLRSPLRRSGVEPVPIPVGPDGLDVAGLGQLGLRAVLVTPAHQFPTGAVLAPERRTALLAWARETDGLIVEDDYDAEYRYDRRPLGALQGLDRDHVVYVGSVSKTLAPGLRLGWIAAPARWVPDIRHARRGTALGLSVLDQFTLADFLHTGGYDRHLRRMRHEYGRRRDLLLRHLRRELPDCGVGGIPAGLHVTLDLSSGVDQDSVIEAAARRGVRLYPLSEFFAGGRLPAGYPGGPHLVLGFGALPSNRIPAGVAQLALALRESETRRAHPR